MFLRTTALKHRGASFYESKPQCQPINRQSPLQRLRLKFRLMLKNILRLMFGLRLVLKFVIFLCFFKGALLPNFKKMIEHELHIMGVRQLEDIFSTALKNLRTWTNTLGLVGNDLVCKDMRRERLSFGRNAQEQN
jgi:hypothetical protein